MTMLSESYQTVSSRLEEKEARLQQGLQETMVAESRLEQVRPLVFLARRLSRLGNDHFPSSCVFWFSA